MISLKVNGILHELNVDPQTPLLWILNEQLGLTGTKYSCGIGECGACTVIIDGEAELACTVTVEEVRNLDIVTIEGLKGPAADALRNAWIEEDVAQCGYCQPGQIMTATALLTNNPDPDDRDIDAAMSGVLCRCGTYQSLRKAIHLAAREVRNGQKRN
jgi:aerobic-type carbon monoxide dehydrogenase small subunit (CoxS/CutS family)